MVQRARRWLSGAKARSTARITSWVGRRSQRVAGHNPWEVAVEVGRAASRHRITGIAAEMSFFAVLALVPLTLAFGAALGSLGRLVGPERVADGHDAAIDVLTTLLGPELTADTVAPFVRDLLAREAGGFAFGSLVIASWLGSRMFAPALHAVDLAYGVKQSRSGLHLRLVGLGMAAGSLLVSVLTLAIMIVGPLLGGGLGLASRLGVGSVYRTLWTVGRWPVLLLLLTAFLTAFFRWGPSAPVRWRDCVPGALVGVALWVLAASGFRLYLAVGGNPGGDVGSGEELIVTVGRAVAAVVATMLWAFLSSLAILLGTEVNAALARGGADAGPR